MILCPRSKVTTSATQFGAHEWLMYLQAAVPETTYYKALEEAFIIPPSRAHDVGLFQILKGLSSYSLQTNLLRQDDE